MMFDVLDAQPDAWLPRSTEHPWDPEYGKTSKAQEHVRGYMSTHDCSPRDLITMMDSVCTPTLRPSTTSGTRPSCHPPRRRPYSANRCATSCGGPPRTSATGSPRKVIPGYTGRVKTAISVPDETFEQATKQAVELGVSRAEFFARAARPYLDELASCSLTQHVDEALQAAGSAAPAPAAATPGTPRAPPPP